MARANPVLPLLVTLAALVVAAGSGLFLFLLLTGAGEPLDTVRLLRQTEAQVLFGSVRRRPPLRVRIQRQARARLNAAGLDDWPLGRVAVLTGLAGYAGALLGALTLGAPPFSALGGLIGLVVPWLWLGRRAERRQRTIATQVAQMLSLMGGAAAAAIPPMRILVEVIPAVVQPPLAETVTHALRRLDPARGIATVGFSEVIADLDTRLESAAFSLARAAIEDTLDEGVPLSDALEVIATLAREDLVFAGEVRAQFALIRGTAALVFALPFVFTLVFRLLEPRLVDEAYSNPLGWLVAGLIAACCVAAYIVVTRTERDAARQARARGA